MRLAVKLAGVLCLAWLAQVGIDVAQSVRELNGKVDEWHSANVDEQNDRLRAVAARFEARTAAARFVILHVIGSPHDPRVRGDARPTRQSTRSACEDEVDEPPLVPCAATH